MRMAPFACHIAVERGLWRSGTKSGVRPILDEIAV
jgi:hypothetical protein